MGFVESKTVKTRKIHKCGFCNNSIPAGTTVEYSSGINDGQWFKSYLCGFCQKYIKFFHEEYADGYCSDDFDNIEIRIPCSGCKGKFVEIVGNSIKDEMLILKCQYCQTDNIGWGMALHYAKWGT